MSQLRDSRCRRAPLPSGAPDDPRGFTLKPRDDTDGRILKEAPCQPSRKTPTGTGRVVTAKRPSRVALAVSSSRVLAPHLCDHSPSGTIRRIKLPKSVLRGVIDTTESGTPSPLEACGDAETAAQETVDQHTARRFCSRGGLDGRRCAG